MLRFVAGPSQGAAINGGSTGKKMRANAMQNNRCRIAPTLVVLGTNLAATLYGHTLQMRRRRLRPKVRQTLAHSRSGHVLSCRLRPGPRRQCRASTFHPFRGRSIRPPVDAPVGKGRSSLHTQGFHGASGSCTRVGEASSGSALDRSSSILGGTEGSTGLRLRSPWRRSTKRHEW